MKNSGYPKMLMMVLMAHYGAMKPEVTDLSHESIPGYGETFSGGEHALVGMEPGPVLFSEASNTESSGQHFLGTDTASRPPVKLGTNPDTYTPRWLDTTSDLDKNELESLNNSVDEQSNLDEIKTNEEKLTDEQVLQNLADLMQEQSPVIEEPGFTESASDYFEQLSKQIEGLNQDLEEILSSKKLNELADKYPLIINKRETEVKPVVGYSDIMKPYSDFSAPDEGEFSLISEPLTK